MNRSVQHVLIGFAIATATTVQAADPPASRITERQVRDLVDKATRAANARDVPAIMQTLADDAKVVFDFRGPGGKRQRARMNRDQYETRAREGMRQMDKYTYRREKVDIAIAARRPERDREEPGPRSRRVPGQHGGRGDRRDDDARAPRGQAPHHRGARRDALSPRAQRGA